MGSFTLLLGTGYNFLFLKHYFMMSSLQITGRGLVCLREFLFNSLRRCCNNAAVAKTLEATENFSEKSRDNTENVVEESKTINSGAVHLKRSKAFQNTNSGSQLATGFPKMDPHNTPELPVGISTTQKHVPKSKEAE